MAAPIARDILLYALYGGLPPLEAYPADQRKAIEEQRAPAASAAAGRPRGTGHEPLRLRRPHVPRGAAKLLAINWSLVLLLTACGSTGFLMLYSVAGGSLDPWAEPQMLRFGLGHRRR